MDDKKRFMSSYKQRELLEGDRREYVLKKILEYSTRLVDFVDENEYFEIMRKINKELEYDDNNLMAA